jgi:hypothetical protein
LGQKLACPNPPHHVDDRLVAVAKHILADERLASLLSELASVINGRKELKAILRLGFWGFAMSGF